MPEKPMGLSGKLPWKISIRKPITIITTFSSKPARKILFPTHRLLSVYACDSVNEVLDGIEVFYLGGLVFA